MAVGVTQSSVAARVKLKCRAAASNARKAFNGIYVRMPGLRSMPPPPRSTTFPVFAPGLHETRQRTSSNFSQIRAETLGAMGAARMHDGLGGEFFEIK